MAMTSFHVSWLDSFKVRFGSAVSRSLAGRAVARDCAVDAWEREAGIEVRLESCSRIGGLHGRCGVPGPRRAESSAAVMREVHWFIGRRYYDIA